MGQENVSSWLQSGMALADRINGSWICWTSLLVIFLEWNTSGETPKQPAAGSKVVEEAFAAEEFRWSRLEFVLMM